ASDHDPHGRVALSRRLSGCQLQLRKSFQMGEVEVGIRIGAGIAPRARVDRGRTHECAEAQLPGLRHGRKLWPVPGTLASGHCADPRVLPMRPLARMAADTK